MLLLTLKVMLAYVAMIEPFGSTDKKDGTYIQKLNRFLFCLIHSINENFIY